MIEATCAACGTLARIAEADVPVGAKFVTCGSCKSRIPLPSSKAAAPAGRPASKPISVPAIPPAIPRTPPPVPGAAAKASIDLADLPAPKRTGPLAGGESSKRTARPPLDGAELPAPKGARVPTPQSLDLDELMAPVSSKAQAGLADLPAPKPRSSALGHAGPSKPAPPALADLPAPKAKPAPATQPARPAAVKSGLELDLPAPKQGGDLPAPRKAGVLGMSDLPAPKQGGALGDLPAPKRAGALGLSDLPAPKQGLELDLPAPKRGGGLSDLPAPKQGLDLDLPAPKRGGALDLGDLPAPKGSAGALELDDLPAPVDGGIALGGDLDLPMPKPGASDLPAPKGFFDDLPQPVTSATAATGLAPKGFFDDLPQPVSSTTATELAPKAGLSDLPAPQGFFDDLPQPAKPAASSGGFFDDLPQPAKPAASSGGFFDDLAPPQASGGGDIPFSASDIELPPVSASDVPLELDSGGIELDSGLPLGQDAAFNDLDLSPPTAGRRTAGPPDEPASPIKIKTPAKGSAPASPIPIKVKKDQGDVSLDLADDPHAKQGGTAAAVGTSAAAAKAQGKRPQQSPEEAAQLRAQKRKRTRLALAGVLGVALLGSGGFYFYKRHAAAQERQDQIASQLTVARKQLGEAHPQHWQRAAGAAHKVIELEPNHGPALGLAAEAALAGALDNGVNYEARVKQGRKLVQDGLGAGKSGPELERAQALMTIAANDPDRAIKMLDKQIARSPKDGWLQLYMGWAQLTKGDAAAAVAALEQAIANTPATKLPATYAIGKAKLLAADLDGAKAAFAAVLEHEHGKGHIGAEVGLAATLPPQQSAQREADLLAILERPDLKKGDPRAVVHAYVLVGDVARKGGRFDIARERYRKALALAALDAPALVGLATVELRDGKPQVAADLLQKALATDANRPETLLLVAELEVVQGKLPDALSKIENLEARTPPLAPLLRARLHVVKGRLLEAQGKDPEAVAEYTDGAKLAGELDLTPTMAAVTKLTAMADKAGDPAKAAGLRKQADALLSALAERAREDGELSLTLGVAYLQAGEAVKAEDSLRRAVALREKDPEAKLHYAKALLALGRTDQGITQLTEALALDPKRTDIALELARTYQKAGRDPEAMAAYERLLADPGVDVIVRANAGRYFARKGAREKAAAQAEPILAAEPDNAAGLYLKGEGLLLAKKWAEARTVLTRATGIDQSEAQYLDALGRAFEGSHIESKDSKYIESARHAYELATKADPEMFHPQLGLGRMLVAANKWDEAIKPLAVASSLDKANAEVMYYMGRAFFGVRHQSRAHKKTAADWFESALKRPATLTVEQRADASWRLAQLYVDLDKAGPAAGAMENATRLGAEIEKQGGTTPEWMTELYYDLGDIYYRLGKPALQKKAWRHYVDRKPKPGVRLTTAQNALATSLQRY